MMRPAMPTRLADARRHALSLPEATEAPCRHMSSYRVRGKDFATVPLEGTHLQLFVAEPARLPPAAVKALLQVAWRHKAPASIRTPP